MDCAVAEHSRHRERPLFRATQADQLYRLVRNLRRILPIGLRRPQNRPDLLDPLVGTELPQSRELGRVGVGLDQDDRVMGVTMWRDRLFAKGGEKAEQGKVERAEHRGRILVVVGRQFNRGFLPCGSPENLETPKPSNTASLKTPSPLKPCILGNRQGNTDGKPENPQNRPPKTCHRPPHGKSAPRNTCRRKPATEKLPHRKPRPPTETCTPSKIRALPRPAPETAL